MTWSMNHFLVNNVYMNNENDNSKNFKHDLVLKRMITDLTRKTGRRKKGKQTTGVLFFNVWQFRHKPSCQQREVTQDPVCVGVTKELLNYCCVVTPKINREGRSTIIIWLRERLSEKVHATIPNGVVGGFEFTILQRNLREWQERPWMYVCEC